MTAVVLSADQLAALRALDTPTVCNAIESFKVRGRVEGFCGMDVRCLSPELGVMVGYAVTLTVDSTTPDAPQDSPRTLSNTSPRADRKMTGMSEVALSLFT